MKTINLKINILFSLVISLVCFLLITIPPVIAGQENNLNSQSDILPQGQSLDDLDKQRRDIQNQIKDLEKQLSSAQAQEKTLKSQLNYLDSQAKLTELKIQDTEYQITKLDKEISELGNRITRLSSTVDSMTEVLLERIVRTYKYNNYSFLDLIFSSKGFSDFLSRIKYLQEIQTHDKSVLINLHATKLNYNDQKTDKQTRQEQQEKLKNELETYKKDLNNQKNAKAELLKVTQNNESNYQSLIKRLTAELASINQAISNIGARIGPINRGDVIAAMGSTGCSTGPHLHFEVYTNAKVSGKSIIGTRSNPHNYWPSQLGNPIRGWPDEVTITADYMQYYYALKATGSYHTGVDLAPKNWREGVGRAILAADGGIAYATSGVCSNPPPGGSSVGKGVIIDHQNGIVTLYWHVL